MVNRMVHTRFVPEDQAEYSFLKHKSLGFGGERADRPCGERPMRLADNATCNLLDFL
jgi:hypothetical protein